MTSINSLDLTLINFIHQATAYVKGAFGKEPAPSHRWSVALSFPWQLVHRMPVLAESIFSRQSELSQKPPKLLLALVIFLFKRC